MIYEYIINGVAVQTGDLICTRDGDTANIAGQFWRFIGKLIPGEVDHIVIYVGPKGRCVEAGAKGRVIEFKINAEKWDARSMVEQRGPIIDEFFGIVYPLGKKSLRAAEIAKKREFVAEYCLKQAKLKKPYNLNLFDSMTEDRFYCSQLAYKAYLEVGVDLNTGIGVPQIIGSESIIFPQEIWDGCIHKKG